MEEGGGLYDLTSVASVVRNKQEEIVQNCSARYSHECSIKGLTTATQAVDVHPRWGVSVFLLIKIDASNRFLKG